MRPRTVIGLAIVGGGIAALIFSHQAGMIGSFTNDEFARIVALAAVLVLVGGAAFSGHLSVDLRNVAIWAGVALVLVGLYAYRDELRPVWSRILGELAPSSPAASGDGVVLRRGADGHFHADALVNGTSLRLLVDTGASRVSLSHGDARAAGINVDALRYVIPVDTANGEVFMAGTHLDAVTIDTLTINDVPAFVAPAGAMRDSVLGMSFLGALTGYAVSGDTLTLTP